MKRYFLAAAVVAATAAGGAAAADELAQVKDALQRTIGGDTKVTHVARSPIDGLYEVFLNGREVGYTNAAGTLYVVGPMVDLRTRTNLSAQRLEDLQRIDFARLPLDKAIVKVKGDGKRKVAVFSDPDCPYCKQLEPELERLDNVTIYTFLYPIASLHPDALRKATLVWCSSDRVSAWDDWMLRGRLPEGVSLSCPTPILEIVELAQRLGIEGTPGIVFSDGRVVPGAIRADDIEARLQRADRS
jgi:thiol:disulfide interchange protein DsbC